MHPRSLNLESTGLSATSTNLLLPSQNTRGLVVSRSHAEVLNSLPSVLLSSQQDCSLSGRGSQRQLIQSQALSTGSFDSGSGRLGEPQSGDRKTLGEGEQTGVVSDGGNGNDGGFGSRGSGDLTSNSGKGERGSVGARHIQTAEDDGVEFGGSASGKEAV